MNCKAQVTPSLAEAIQLAEDHINAHRESIISDLTTAVIIALEKGALLKNLKITEVTTFSDLPRRANYSVRVVDKITHEVYVK